VLDGIEGNGAALDGISDRRRHRRQREDLQQSQNLNELPSATFVHAGFQQAAQLGEHIGQLPSLEWSGLVQCAGLLLQQGEIMQGIEHEVGTVV